MGLPTIYLLGTGGTIAGIGETEQDMTVYVPGAMDISELLQTVPQVSQHARVIEEQACKLGGFNMTIDVWLQMARRINELLADDAVDGIVITHGTDTIEDTAYFLHLTVKSNKPVVVTGAMRPATAMSADGPVNVLNAVRLAASKKAWGRGVLVALNDEIHGARDVVKTNTTRLQTFKSPGLGALGGIVNGEPEFYCASTRRHTCASEFEPGDRTALPCVKTVYYQVGDDRTFIDAAVAARAQGIVHVGTGNGNIPLYAEAALKEASEKGILIVRASRTGSGAVVASAPRWDEWGFVAADTLVPGKARILLMLALTRTKDPKEVRRIFAEY